MKVSRRSLLGGLASLLVAPRVGVVIKLQAHSTYGCTHAQLNSTYGRYAQQLLADKDRLVEEHLRLFHLRKRLP